MFAWLVGFILLSKITPRFRTLLERFTQPSPTTNVNVFSFDSWTVVPNTINSVLFSFNFRKFWDIHNRISFIQVWMRPVWCSSDSAELFLNDRYNWVWSAYDFPQYTMTGAFFTIYHDWCIFHNILWLVHFHNILWLVHFHNIPWLVHFSQYTMAGAFSQYTMTGAFFTIYNGWCIFHNIPWLVHFSQYTMTGAFFTMYYDWYIFHNIPWLVHFSQYTMTGAFFKISFVFTNVTQKYTITHNPTASAILVLKQII